MFFEIPPWARAGNAGGAIAFKSATHYESPTRILRGLANFYCLPGRAGGLPTD